MPRRTRRIIFARDSSHIVGLVLILLGLTPIIVVLLSAWVSEVSFLDLSALNRFLWSNKFYFGSGIGFELVYLVIAGAVTVILGVILLVRRAKRIEELTVITEKEDLGVAIECTVCKHRWKESFSKKQLHSMGFPQNRTISRRKCRACGRFTRPKIVSI